MPQPALAGCSNDGGLMKTNGKIGTRARRALPALLVLIAILAPVETGGSVPQAQAAFNDGWKKGRSTGFPIPRFVSLKSRTAHMRVGPSLDHPTSYVYSARGLPLEIIEEYGNWRRVRDQQGASGWMFAALLSGNRTAVVGPWIKETVPLRIAPASDGRPVAQLQAEVKLDIVRCDGRWCRAQLQNRRLAGFIRQADLWGVYPGETIE